MPEGKRVTNSNDYMPAICLKIRGGSDTYVKHDGSIGTAGKGALMSEETAFTISATQDQMLFAPSDISDYVVRRITPLEAERLQGMPDDYTRIPWRGKPAEECPDGPRYKAIGNSMSINIMRFLGERLQMVDEALRDEP